MEYYTTLACNSVALAKDCSRGRIRTDNQLITLILMFPEGVDYIIALSK